MIFGKTALHKELELIPTMSGFDDMAFVYVEIWLLSCGMEGDSESSGVFNRDYIFKKLLA